MTAATTLPRNASSLRGPLSHSLALTRQLEDVPDADYGHVRRFDLAR